MIHNAIEWLKSLHSPETFTHWLSTGGLFVVTAIVFAETGLLLGFFLPGDSLLITTGVLSNPSNPHYILGLSVYAFHLTLTIAAIVGDQLGYFLGRQAGQGIFSRPDTRFFKKKYVENARDFYARYGTLAIVLSRFIPIIRTFVPFVAGVTQMKFTKYLMWDVLGGLLWINLLLAVGYYLGQTEYANRLDKIIVIVILVSVLPIFFGIVRGWFRNRCAVSNS